MSQHWLLPEDLSFVEKASMKFSCFFLSRLKYVFEEKKMSYLQKSVNTETSDIRWQNKNNIFVLLNSEVSLMAKNRTPKKARFDPM